MTVEQLSQLLRNARRTSGLRQADVAAAVRDSGVRGPGISVDTIMNWENERGVSTVAAFLTAIECCGWTVRIVTKRSSSPSARC